MKQKLGKVMITPKGEWDSTTAYEHLDIVNSGGASWLAKRANTAITPVEGDDWMQISKDGEVTKDSIVDALGYEPQKAEGKFELIETITVTEDAVIDRTATSDGKAYKFREMFIVATTDGTVQAPGFYFYRVKDDNSTGLCGYAFFPSLNEAYKKAAIRCYTKNGYWWSEQHAAGGRVTLGARRLSGDEYILRYEKGQNSYIYRILSNIAVKVGITLQIYAVWA